MKPVYWVAIILVVFAAAFVASNFFFLEGVAPLGQYPSIDVEATVSSLYLDDLNADCTEPIICAMDRATLRIDKIDRTYDPSNIMDINVGNEIEFNLKYGSRPAKLVTDVPPTCPEGLVLVSGRCKVESCSGPACQTQAPDYVIFPAEMKDGYIIYHLPRYKDEVTEVLPGFSKGSVILVHLDERNFRSNKEIGYYKLIRP